MIKIEPDEGISMRFEAKVPGPKDHVRSVYMDFNYGSGFGVQSPPAYERLIGDAMLGDQTLFTRWDAVERAWEIVTPILDVWRNTKDFSFPNYAAGSQGPESAKILRGLAPPVSVNLDSILDELTESYRERGCEASVATMTVVVFFENPAIGELARERIRMLAAKHPSRVIVLDGAQTDSMYRVEGCDWVELGLRKALPRYCGRRSVRCAFPKRPSCSCGSPSVSATMRASRC